MFSLRENQCNIVRETPGYFRNVEELKLELQRRPALCDTTFDQEETSTQHCVFPVFPIDQNSIPNRFTGENSDYSVENFKFAVEMYLGNQSTQNIHLVDDYDKITWIGNLLANGGQVSV